MVAGGTRRVKPVCMHVSRNPSSRSYTYSHERIHKQTHIQAQTRMRVHTVKNGAYVHVYVCIHVHTHALLHVCKYVRT